MFNTFNSRGFHSSLTIVNCRKENSNSPYPKSVETTINILHHFTSVVPIERYLSKMPLGRTRARIKCRKLTLVRPQRQIHQPYHARRFAPAPSPRGSPRTPKTNSSQSTGNPTRLLHECQVVVRGDPENALGADRAPLYPHVWCPRRSSG